MRRCVRTSPDLNRRGSLCAGQAVELLRSRSVPSLRNNFIRVCLQNTSLAWVDIFCVTSGVSGVCDEALPARPHIRSELSCCPPRRSTRSGATQASLQARHVAGMAWPVGHGARIRPRTVTAGVCGCPWPCPRPASTYAKEGAAQACQLTLHRTLGQRVRRAAEGMGGTCASARPTSPELNVHAHPY